MREDSDGIYKVKVVKATPLTDGTTSEFSWDYTSSGSYNNIWATVTSGNYSDSSTSGSQLMRLLNNGAWWNGTSGKYYNNSTVATSVNFANYKLSDKAKNFVSISRYYLGGYYNDVLPLTIDMYGYERGTLRYDTSRPLYWDGRIGLMYPSDYGYVAGNKCAIETSLYDFDGECYQKDWVHKYSYEQWLMTPDGEEPGYVLIIYSAGYVGDDGDGYINNLRNVFPSFYLTSNTLISGGDGSLNNPYTITLE